MQPLHRHRRRLALGPWRLQLRAFKVEPEQVWRTVHEHSVLWVARGRCRLSRRSRSVHVRPMVRAEQHRDEQDVVPRVRRCCRAVDLVNGGGHLRPNHRDPTGDFTAEGAEQLLGPAPAVFVSFDAHRQLHLCKPLRLP